VHEATLAHQAGNLDQAEALYRSALKIDRKQFDVLSMLAILYAQRGNFLDAEPLLRKAVKLNPREANSQFNHGNVLLALERFDDALAAFDKALQINPKLIEAHLNRGNILMLRNRYEEAAASFDSAIRINRNYAQAYCNRGHALEKMERLDDALVSCDRALNLNPQNAEFYASRANILNRLKRYDEALSDISRALSLRPNNADFHYNHGNILVEARQHRDAIKAFAKASTLEPAFNDAHFNEGLCRLLLGDTKVGWEKYEYRLQLPDYLDLKRKFHAPFWRGDRTLDGTTVLIHGEQGFGDNLMACRYVPLIAALGARVVLEVKPELLRLMQNLEGVFRLVARGDAVPPYDFHCPIMSLPFAFKTLLETIPKNIPYLQPPKERVDQWRSKLGHGGLNVGIAWAGNPSFKKDSERSITLKNILPVCSVAAATFFSIQKDLRDGDVEVLDANPHITHLGNGLSDFLDTAAVMQSLDLIVSSDTSVVNLAGALGRPVWVLLSSSPDWRWLLDRPDSPWYPTARLFRQKKGGDWGPVADEARAELQRMVASQAAKLSQP